MKLFEVTFKGENSKPDTKKILTNDMVSLFEVLSRKIWVNTITSIIEIEVETHFKNKGQ